MWLDLVRQDSESNKDEENMNANDKSTDAKELVSADGFSDWGISEEVNFVQSNWFNR